MVKCGKWPVGFCNWSIGCDTDTMQKLKDQLGFEHVHLALGPALQNPQSKYFETVRNMGLTVTSAMVGFEQEDYSTLDTIKKTGGIVPDDCWDKNREHVIAGIELAAEFGTDYLSAHWGFIDSADPQQESKLIARMSLLADAAAKKDVTILMETGQETAEHLVEFITKLDHPAIGVNFDPANMILYGKGNPIEAVQTLAPWIKQVHIKDAVQPQTPGTWGSEVPWSKGDAGGEKFLDTLSQAGFNGPLAIEREAGNQRLEDITETVEILKQYEP